MSVDPIVTAEWLEQHLDDPTVRIVDCRGYVVARMIEPGVEEADYLGAEHEYLAGHIPGAVYVDWTRDIINPDDSVPVQVATPEQFAEAMASRGIGDDTHVIAVDHMGGQFATRLWWALRYYGHDRVSVLDGGWNRWMEEEGPIEEGTVEHPRALFTPKVRPGLRKTAEDVRDLIGSSAVQLVDARDTAQFQGTKRRGPRDGHIPGAISVPREKFLAQGGGFLPIEEVRSRVASSGLDDGRPIVAYCNGGVAATVLLFNLHRIGVDDWANYDGSWNEWGNRTDLPVSSAV